MATTTNKIIDRIIDAETPNDNPATPQDERAVVTNDPNDRGGRTQLGISERSNPQAWADGKVSEAEARDIYRKKYLQPFAGLEDHVGFEQFVDFGVVSGPALVAQKLQSLVGVDVDGQIGPQTLAAIAAVEDRRLNNLMVAERVRMIGRIVKRDPRQLKWINGWLERALGFLR